MKKIGKKIISKKGIFMGLLVLAAAVFLILPNVSLAAGDPSLNTVQRAIVDIFSGIFNIIIGALGALLSPLIYFVVGLLEYNNFINAQAVEIGWVLVRDLSNMFFVIFLLVIAFSTILKISSYNYKSSLPKILLMAVLVNFSKTIVGFLVDFGQVIMITFVNAFAGAGASVLVDSLKVTKILNIDPGTTDLEMGQIFAALFLGLIVMVVSIGVMLAYVAVLLYRIIVLWVLILLSPLAFVLSAFQGTSKYASEYWSEFWKQLTTGIILAFFMWLSFSILSVAKKENRSLSDELMGSGQSAQTAQQQLQNAGKTTEAGLGWDEIFTFIVSIALLLIALQYAQKAGGFAGTFAGKVSGTLSRMGTGALKVAGSPFKALKTGAQRVTMTAERKILDFSTAKGTEGSGFRKNLKYVTKAGWEGAFRRGEELTKRSREKATAYAHDEANYLMTGKKLKTSHGVNISEKQAKETAEEYSISGLEDLKEQFQNVLRMDNGKEKDDRIRGLFAIASKNAWIDDLQSIPEILEKFTTEEEKKDINERKEFKAKKQAEGLSKEEVDQAMVDKYGSDSVYANTEITSRQKQGEFFRWIATSTQTGKLSQEGLNLIYSHEENAFANGHLQDIGYVRTAEKDFYKDGKLVAKKGDLRLLDYNEESKDKDGFTEADRMGITETSKRDPKSVAKAQKHSFGTTKVDGTLGYGDAYFQTMRDLAGGSEGEPHRLNMLLRNARNLLGGTATDNPKVNMPVDDQVIGVIKVENKELGDVLSRFNSKNDRNYTARGVSLVGGSFVQRKMNKDTNQMELKMVDLREAAKSGGEAILKVKDKNNQDINLGINVVTGAITQLDDKLNEIAGKKFSNLDSLLKADILDNQVADKLKQNLQVASATKEDFTPPLPEDAIPAEEPPETPQEPGSEN
jgi:hypothetical protein